MIRNVETCRSIGYIVVIYTFMIVTVHLWVIIKIKHASSLIRQHPEAVK